MEPTLYADSAAMADPASMGMLAGLGLTMILIGLLALVLGIFVVSPFALKWGASVSKLKTDLGYGAALGYTIASGLLAGIIGGILAGVADMSGGVAQIVQLVVYLGFLYLFLKKFNPTVGKFFGTVGIMFLVNIVYGLIIGAVFWALGMGMSSMVPAESLMMYDDSDIEEMGEDMEALTEELNNMLEGLEGVEGFEVPAEVPAE